MVSWCSVFCAGEGGGDEKFCGNTVYPKEGGGFFVF